MMSRASGLMTRSPNMSCLIGSQYWLSAGFGSAFSLAYAGTTASKARRAASARRKHPFIPDLLLLGELAKYTSRSPDLFPFQFGIGRRHVTAMEQVEGGPVPRFGKSDFIGRLLDGPAIADGGTGLIQYHGEVALLCIERLRPRQIAAAMSGHIVIGRNDAQILHDGEKPGDGADDALAVAHGRQAGIRRHRLAARIFCRL